jgi:hypothetical protein
MALSASQTTVSTAVALNTANSNAFTKLTISNGAAVLWLGGSNVDATHGASVAANTIVKLDLNPGEVVWGFCATSTVVGIIAQVA